PTFSSSTVTFSWSAGTATNYVLLLGSALNSTDIYSSSLLSTLTTTAAGLPTDGRTIYASLYSNVSGSWLVNRYTYRAFSASATPTPTPTPTVTPTPTPTATPSPSATPSSSPAVSVTAAPTSLRSRGTATFTISATTSGAAP